MLASELRRYLDSLKPKANTISDEQLRGMITIAGYGEEVFAEAIDYFRSPSAPPAAASTASSPLPLRKAFIPTSVLKEMTREAQAIRSDVVTERRPSLLQWMLLVVFALGIPAALLLSLQRTMPALVIDVSLVPTLFRDADTNTLLALAPALLAAFASIFVSFVLARRAYRTKGRPIISFLFGISLQLLVLVAAYVGVHGALALMKARIPQEGALAIVQAAAFAPSLYAVLFAGSFVLGTFLLLISYARAVPLQETFQHSAGGQVRVILFAALLAAYLFNIAYAPALLFGRTEGCYLVFDAATRTTCLAQIQTLESARPDTPIPLESPDDQYLRDVRAL